MENIKEVCMKNFFEMIFENFKLTRFIGQILFYGGLMACSICNIELINLLVGVVLIAALYFMVVDPSTILNMQRDFEDTWSSVETFTTPFLQTALIIVLYCTHHRGLLMLFLAVEAVYFCIRNLYKRGHIG